MEYPIHALAELAGVSTRTLRWYHQQGLLRPSRVDPDSGYRYYGGPEVDRLQQILFYRALGVELAQIGRLLDDPLFDRMAALRGHLAALEQEETRIRKLIHTVRQTILSEEGDVIMTDQDKFAAFKRRLVEENEEAYGKEIRERYGDDAVDRSNAQMLSMTQEEYDGWTALGEEILAALCAAVRAGMDPAGEEGGRIADLHRRWLTATNRHCGPAMHRGIAQMYVADERFTAYYDRDQSGCARFLWDAVMAHIE